MRIRGFMYFLNLSLVQFVAVFGSISAISVALYLLDRSRRKRSSRRCASGLPRNSPPWPRGGGGSSSLGRCCCN